MPQFVGITAFGTPPLFSLLAFDSNRESGVSGPRNHGAVDVNWIILAIANGKLVACRIHSQRAMACVIEDSRIALLWRVNVPELLSHSERQAHPRLGFVRREVAVRLRGAQGRIQRGGVFS